MYTMCGLCVYGTKPECIMVDVKMSVKSKMRISRRMGRSIYCARSKVYSMRPECNYTVRSYPPCRRLTASKTFPGGVWEALRRLRGGSWRLQDGSAERFGGFQEAFLKSSFLRAFLNRFFDRFWVPCWDPKTVKNRHTLTEIAFL